MPNHHYVPQFYLRRFGAGEQVSVILMNHGFRFVERAKIKGQSSRPDYYRLREAEKHLSLIEGIASRLMQNISQHIQLTSGDVLFLKQYAALQILRTPAFVQTIGEVREGMLSVLASHKGCGLSEEVVSSVFPDAELLTWRQIGDGCDAVRDLEMRYLISKREGFLTSDQPVAIYNPWLLKGGVARNGFGCRGLMLFLPINSRISIMLYDSEVYSIRSRDRRSTFITIERDDEARLNKLQMVGNRSVLYLPQPDRYLEVQSLAREVRSAHPPEMNSPFVRRAESADGESRVYSVEEQPVDFGDWTFLYESSSPSVLN